MESPEHVRLSLAAAMTLKFARGLFYRNARLRCINLLLTYETGCVANCSFCGLAREKRKKVGDKDFIRVAWKAYPMADIIDRLKNHPDHVERVCISMITHPRCKPDVLTLTREICEQTDLPVSLLISPTILDREDLEAMKEAGAERIGVAIDCANPDLFDRLRGRQVNGPHRWDKYWEIYEQSIDVFGKDMAGVHLIVGLGETEKQMAEVIGRSRDMGGLTHLFSFFPEKGSELENLSQPPIGQYRRIQATRYLIDTDRTSFSKMKFNSRDQIVDFGIDRDELGDVLKDGVAFETSGCPGASGQTACNRPYGNERPGPDIRNFPFSLEPADLEKAMNELFDYSSRSFLAEPNMTDRRSNEADLIPRSLL